MKIDDLIAVAAIVAFTVAVLAGMLNQAVELAGHLAPLMEAHHAACP